MKLVDGVQLHLLKSEKFKTNHITFRFSGDFNQKSVAKRVLVAQMMATANELYPTAKDFREKLAQLYGANLSTSVSTKGLVHIVDIDISFIQERFALKEEKLLDEVIQFLKGILFHPLLSVAQYQPKVFEIEKTNLINYIESDNEDSFYYSALEAKKLFYTDSDLQVSKYGNTELIEKETAYTSYQEFHKMLMEDQIDIYIMGDFDEYRVLQLLHQFPFEARQKELSYYYQQDYVNVVKDVNELKPVNQSIFELSYYFPTLTYSENNLSMVLLNGLLGSFAHSPLFTTIRESEGMAYTIGSRLDVYTGRLAISAGIDKENRTKTLQLITKELNDLKTGRFSSALLEKTKLMILTNALQSDDYSKAIIDRHYTSKYVNQNYDLETWIKNVHRVSKRDIVKAANHVKLQSLYFLEGK
ncbi:EF-P 5-aminopentanol modification-associated protein YfmF [Streptococcus catagoni]|uniref:EF-P 5-aminopentanol modification-associated protein YfmF n=1 Tax=Streptococcus catagoni TaxID=2654874 RepID=UPI00140D9685|nr:pitrilysin family protein [Streptococcus catagoni]